MYISRLDATIGTFAWAAPELLLNDKCTEKVDIFSLGVVLWEVRSLGFVPAAVDVQHVLISRSHPMA